MKLVLIDGNSIMNRAFYGIMGSKMLTTKDGTYTNAVYGFLAILFKVICGTVLYLKPLPTPSSGYANWK